MKPDTPTCRTDALMEEVTTLRKEMGMTVEDLWLELHNNYFAAGDSIRLSTMYGWFNRGKTRILPFAERVLALQEWIKDNTKTKKKRKK